MALLSEGAAALSGVFCSDGTRRVHVRDDVQIRVRTFSRCFIRQ